MLALIISSLLITAVSAQSICPDGWVQNVDSCYHFSTDTEEWISAQEMCKLRQSTLVRIETMEEDIFISNYIRNFSSVYKQYWIGLTDWDQENHFIWEPEQIPTQYTNWGPGEPDNDHTNQHCTIINVDEHYQWYDRECRQQYNYICEKDTSLSVIIG